MIRAKLSLGVMLLDADRASDAETYLRESKDYFDATFGARNARRLTALRMLGSALLATAQYEEAEPLLLEAEELLRPGEGEDDQTYERVRRDLATLYERTGRPDPAWRQLD